MENWWRLHFEPLLSIARETGVAEVTQNVRGHNLETVTPQFMRGVLAMLNRGTEHAQWNSLTDVGEVGCAGSYESGQLGFWWAEPLTPEEIDEYVL